MFRSRKLGIGLTATAALVTGMVVLPGAADADSCTIAVTLATGQHLTFNVDVAPGTPLSSINLPITGTVSSLSESCAAPATAGTDTTVAPISALTTTTATDSTTTPATATIPTPGATSTPESTTTDAATTPGTVTAPVATTTPATTTSPLTITSPLKVSAQRATTTPGQPGTTTAAAATTTTGALTEPDGVPTDTNPTYSFALPGAAAVGVPNFFIDSFEIPPFLLPIYQAAGIEYNVPWQVLAAINWIETDYGRDLSVSSAGAVGWMQFLPSTFKRWGVDATGTGYADPYNPTDAIFTAARYLSAAGASQNLSKAIFAYNHATWYVNSVLLRAQLIGGMPADLVDALSNLVEGHFPVAAPAKYADDSVLQDADRKVSGTNAAIPVESTAATATSIYAKAGSPVIAVNDGKIVDLGRSATLGNFVVLQDSDGNVYTYSHLGSLTKLYAVPKPISTTRAELAQEIAGAGSSSAHAPASAATAGLQPDATITTAKTTVPVAKRTAKGTRQTLKSLLTVTLHRPAAAQQTSGSATAATAHAATVTTPHATSASHATASGATAATGSTAADAGSDVGSKERLFADPTRPASYADGGEEQINDEGAEISNFQDYFSDVLHLAPDQYTLAPLSRGSVVVAGTVLGRIGVNHEGQAPHVVFQIQPGGSKSTYIDPKPVLDGWKLLEATSIYRANGLNPFLSSGKQATIGQILLESKSQLQEAVLADPRVSIYACGRRDIQAGSIDRRVLAAIEYLAASGLDPTISGLKCGAGSDGIDSAGQTGSSVDISAINGIPVAGHDGTGSVTDIAIRRLLALQGAMAPNQIISAISYKGQASTLSLPDHRNRIQVTYIPQFGTDPKLTQEVKSILKPSQWIQLISHISEIPEPAVPTARSPYAVRTDTQ